MRQLLAILVVFFAGLSMAVVAQNTIEESGLDITETNHSTVDTFDRVNSPLLPQADILFYFAAFDASPIAWGDTYWNPNVEEGGTGWAMDTVQLSTDEPSGSPYHWNGGLGTAATTLGATWEWYATYTSGGGTQTTPDFSDYCCVFVFTFDNWWDEGITSATRTTLGTYMDADGHVILISQDGHYGGIPGSWLDTYFSCGAITDDVYWDVTPVPMNGTTGTFLAGWSGTATQSNFSTANPFFPDDVETNPCIDDGTYDFASYNDTNKCMYSTAEFEACAESEVEAILDLILEWACPDDSIQSTSLGNIKTLFAE